MKPTPEQSILLSLFKAQVEKRRGMEVDVGEMRQNGVRWSEKVERRVLARQRLSAARNEMETGGRAALHVRKGACSD